MFLIERITNIKNVTLKPRSAGMSRMIAIEAARGLAAQEVTRKEQTMAKSRTEVAEHTKQSLAQTTSLQPVEDLAHGVAEAANECLERLVNIADLLFGALPTDTEEQDECPRPCLTDRTMCSLDAAYKSIYSLKAVISRFEG